MEFIWSLLSFIGGWLASYWQNLHHEKQGIEQGARAAFSIENSLPDYLLKAHPDISDTFKNLDWQSTPRISDAADRLGRAYRSVIRYDAFSDAQQDNIHHADRAEWKLQRGEDMPPVTFHEGYVQALVDIMEGMRHQAPRYFPDHVIQDVLHDLDASQREGLDLAYEGTYYSTNWKPNGREFGTLLIDAIITHLTPPYPPPRQRP
jgi:hypothetical protein